MSIEAFFLIKVDLRDLDARRVCIELISVLERASDISRLAVPVCYAVAVWLTGFVRSECHDQPLPRYASSPQFVERTINAFQSSIHYGYFWRLQAFTHKKLL